MKTRIGKLFLKAGIILVFFSFVFITVPLGFVFAQSPTQEIEGNIEEQEMGLENKQENEDTEDLERDPADEKDEEGVGEQDQAAEDNGSDHAEPLEAAPIGNTFGEVSSAIISLIVSYFNTNGRYPRSWGDYRYSDIGLDASAWSAPKSHIIYTPSGDKLLIKPEKGYGFEAARIHGETIRMSYSLNYNFIYSVGSGTWYYHSIAQENRIDIVTFQVYAEGEAGSNAVQKQDEPILSAFHIEEMNSEQINSEQQDYLLLERGGINSEGLNANEGSQTLVRTPGYISVSEGDILTLKGYTDKATAPRIYFYNDQKAFISLLGSDHATVPEGVHFIRVRLTVSVAGDMIEAAYLESKPKVIPEDDLFASDRTFGGENGSLIFQRGSISSSNGQDENDHLLNIIRTPSYLEAEEDMIYMLQGYEDKAEYPRLYFYDQEHHFLGVAGSDSGKAPAHTKYARVRLTLVDGKEMVGDVFLVASNNVPEEEEQALSPSNLSMQALSAENAKSADMKKWTDHLQGGITTTWGGDSRIYILNPYDAYTITAKIQLLENDNNNGGYGVFFATYLDENDPSKDNGYIVQFDRGFGEGAIIIRKRQDGRELSPIKRFGSSEGGIVPTKSSNPSWWSQVHTIKITVRSAEQTENAKHIQVYIDDHVIFDFEEVLSHSNNAGPHYTGFRSWTGKSIFYSLDISGTLASGQDEHDNEKSKDAGPSLEEQESNGPEEVDNEESKDEDPKESGLDNTANKGTSQKTDALPAEQSITTDGQKSPAKKQEDDAEISVLEAIGTEEALVLAEEGSRIKVLGLDEGMLPFTGYAHKYILPGIFAAMLGALFIALLCITRRDRTVVKEMKK